MTATLQPAAQRIDAILGATEPVVRKTADEILGTTPVVDPAKLAVRISSLFVKASHVKQYQRTTSTGKTVTVKEHDAFRNPPGAPSGRLKHAVLIIDGQRYKGPSHFQALMAWAGSHPEGKGLPKVPDTHQGFETESGHYLDREAAADYALGKGQVKKDEADEVEQNGRLKAEQLQLAAKDGRLYTEDAVIQATAHKTVSGPPGHDLARARAEKIYLAAIVGSFNMHAGIATALLLAAEEAFTVASMTLYQHLDLTLPAVQEDLIGDAEKFAQERAPLLKNFCKDFNQEMDDLKQRHEVDGQEDQVVIARNFKRKAKELAKRVVETEAQATYGSAEIRLLKRAGFKTKIWMTCEDDQVRPTHVECGDQGAVAMDKPFVNGLLFPGDPKGPAEEVCGCRCWLVGGEREESAVQASHIKTYQRTESNGKVVTVHEHNDKRIPIMRVGSGKTAKWVTHEGHDLPAHAAKFKIPPAWKNAHISKDPNDDNPVMGEDTKNRRTVIRSDEATARTAAEKFSRNKELLSKRHYIFKQNDENLKSENPNTRENAACMKLIQQTGIRPGSDKDTGAKVKAYGATTLEGRHVAVEGEKVTLNFVGKKGVALSIPVEDKATAEMLKLRKALAGNNGRLFNTNSSKLQDYSHTLNGGSFKPKDFRTLKGTETALAEIEKDPTPAKSQESYKERVMSIAKKVAKALGNTPVIALQSYINPFVFERIQPV